MISNPPPLSAPQPPAPRLPFSLGNLFFILFNCGAGSPAVVDFLRSAHVGRTAPPVEEKWDSQEEAEVEEMGDGEEQAG